VHNQRLEHNSNSLHKFTIRCRSRGFLFSGIVVIVSRRSTNNIEAVGLFCASIATLGFDSYLFSATAGEDASICARTWSEGLIASGLLVVGSVGLLDGIGWLVLGHFSNTETSGSVGPAIRRLAKTVQVMVHGAIASLALLLALTAWNCVQAMDPTPPWWLHLLLLAAALLVSPVAIAAASRHRRHFRKRTLGMPSGITAGPVVVASFGTLIYGLGAPVVIGVFVSLPRAWWTSTSSTLLIMSLIVGFVIPLILLVAWGLTVPSLTKNVEIAQVSHTGRATLPIGGDKEIHNGINGRERGVHIDRNPPSEAAGTASVSIISTLAKSSVAVTGEVTEDEPSPPSRVT
jgi:hypothetical protein